MANTTKYAKWFASKTLTKPASFRRAKSAPSAAHPKKGFQQIFRRLDSDGDGRISRAELKTFLGWAGDRSLPEEAAAVVCDLAVDGDGLIDYCTFVRLVGLGGEEGRDEDIRSAFEMFEGEEEGEGGCITAKGLQRVLGRLGEEKTREECAAMIGFYDLDGDGVLDYHEFYRMMG